MADVYGASYKYPIKYALIRIQDFKKCSKNLITIYFIIIFLNIQPLHACFVEASEIEESVRTL